MSAWIRGVTAIAFAAGVSGTAMAMETGEPGGNDARVLDAQQTRQHIIRRATPADAVSRLVVERDIPVTYDYVATLMRIPNAFGEGAACVVCHSSNDPKNAYRGLDLSTCVGMLKGATEPPFRGLAVVAGDPEASIIRRFLRNNRMPLGVPFDHPTDTKPILAIKKWIDDGAKKDEFFTAEILPLFKMRKIFGSFAACTDCHMSTQEPPSFNGLNLTSYEGIMLGSNAVARAKNKLPPVRIVKSGDSAGSILYQRLVENRMPAGISPGETRDHPNVRLLIRWIEQGAKCK